MTSENANLILPGLWLGNRYAAADTAFLTNQRIKTVFNCTKQLPFDKSVTHQYRVPVDDNLEASEISNMEKWAPEIVYKLVAEYKAGNQILVHCHAGMQRSAAVVAMFLIAVFKKPTDYVVQYIRERRGIAFFPLINFERAIRGFEARYLSIMNKN
jgi:protein-tyrosine phosphatase